MFLQVPRNRHIWSFISIHDPVLRSICGWKPVYEVQNWCHMLPLSGNWETIKERIAIIRD